MNASGCSCERLGDEFSGKEACACSTHIPAVERLLGNPSKMDLELVGGEVGRWRTEGEGREVSVSPDKETGTE